MDGLGQSITSWAPQPSAYSFTSCTRCAKVMLSTKDMLIERQQGCNRVPRLEEKQEVDLVGLEEDRQWGEGDD